MDIYWCQLKQTRCCTRLTHKFNSAKRGRGPANKRAAWHSQKRYFPIIWLQICHLSISTLSDIIQFEHLRAALIQLNQLNQWSSSHKFKSGQLCSKGRRKRVRKRGRQIWHWHCHNDWSVAKGASLATCDSTEPLIDLSTYIYKVLNIYLLYTIYRRTSMATYSFAISGAARSI